MIPAGRRSKCGPDQLRQAALVHFSRAEGVDADGDRVRHADGVGHLNFALVGQPGGHDVFGHIACGVGPRAVHLGRVFPGEGPSAVAGVYPRRCRR